MKIASDIDVLISEEELHARIADLGARITADYAGTRPVLVGVLKGSFMFMADLVRQIDLPVATEFLALSSYQGSSSTGVVQMTLDLSSSIQGRDVLVVEDIVDTGLTMQYMLNNLRTRLPRTLKVCSLLHKPAREKVKISIDYLGFTIEDKFVVGYGLDYDEAFRNLPFIGVMRPDSVALQSQEAPSQDESHDE